MAHQSSDYDVLVIGGGPAGSAAATQLARRGRRVLLLERQTFPRFHIGESLLPASNDIFRTLGLEEQVTAARFVEKRGASFLTEDGAFHSYVDFTACPDVDRPVTYQVERSHFDKMLLDNAIAAGADVRQGWRVQEVEFAPDQVTATVVDPEGESHAFTSAVVLDASGQSGFLSKRLGLRQADPRLRNVALFSHFEGIPLPPGDRSGDIRVVTLREMGWIWFIPLSETVTSVGVVMSLQAHAARPAEAAEAFMDRCLAAAPAAAAQMVAARRVSPARYEADFCYTARIHAGDRWLLAGDAGSFLDPVFSTGVLIALESGLEAAAAIDRGLRRGDVSARQFTAFSRTQARRYKYFRRFVRGFYDPPFRDLFIQTANSLGLRDALVAILAGNWRPPLSVRLRVELFFFLVTVQRYLPLAPRNHRQAA